MEAKLVETTYIVSRPDILGGKPIIAGHRISVDLVAALYEDQGLSVKEINRQLPTLTPAQIHAALAFYYDHREEILRQRDEEEQALANAPNAIHLTAEQLDDPNFKLVMTPREIAQEFGVTVDAVYQAVRRGAIPHRRSGGTILIARWEAEKRWKVKSRRGRPKRGKAE